MLHLLQCFGFGLEFPSLAGFHLFLSKLIVAAVPKIPSLLIRNDHRHRSYGPKRDASACSG